MTKLSHKDVPKEWQEKVKARAIQQGVDEDEVIRYGLNYDFKEKADDKEVKQAQKDSDKTLKDAVKVLDDILKELKKK